MAIPKSKEELIEAINSEYAKLNSELKSVPPHLVGKKNLEGHKKDTVMSIHNLVSYLVGWGQLVLSWIDDENNNIDIVFPHKDFGWNQLGELALKFYKDYESLPFKELIESFVQNKNALLSIINDLSSEELYNVAFYKHYPLGRMIQLNTSSPYKNARLRIRKWKKAESL